MHFRSTHNFLLKICSRSRCRAARVSGSAHARRWREEKGVTLIDTVVGSALIVLVFVGIVGAFQLSIDVILNNRARAGAIALMNERMEYVRSLDYSSVGTVGGIPSGAIQQSESVTLSGIPFTRRTTIQYVDDPEDGTDLADANNIIVDYKQVRIEVSWNSRTGTRSVYIVARVEPLDGLEVNCGAPCGTLRIDVLDASSTGVPDTQVRIVNSSAVPAVDITTYTNDDGRVVLAGAPVASGYEVSVSRTGYNSAQTYDLTVGNPNPTPGHQSVFKNQTTSLTLSLPNSGIDVLATKQVYSRTPVLSGTWTDPMDDTSKFATSTNLALSSGAATLATSEGAYASSGDFQSIAIAPASVVLWKEFSWSATTPPSTSIRFRFYDGSGTTLIPDEDLPGNSVGFTTSPVDLFNLATSTYPSFRIVGVFSTSDASSTPSLDSYAVRHANGPFAEANVTFDMHGAKQIGSDPVIYKYDEAGLDTGASSVLVLSNMEWDTYTMTVATSSGYELAYACPTQPEYLAPGTIQSTYLHVVTAGEDGLRIAVTSGGAPVGAATVTIAGTGFSDVALTGSCGQAFFASLTSGSYDYTVSAPGYTVANGTATVSGLTIENVELTAE